MCAMKKYIPLLLACTALAGCTINTAPSFGAVTTTESGNGKATYRLASSHWTDVSKIRDEATRLNDQVGQNKITKVQAAQYLNRFRLKLVGSNPVDDSVYEVYLRSAVDSQRGAITSAQSKQYVQNALKGWQQRWPNMRSKPNSPAFANFLMELMNMRHQNTYAPAHKPIKYAANHIDKQRLIKMYQQIVFAAATAILAPAAFAALEHPAQQQVQQNIDTVLKIIKNQSLSEQQKIRQVKQYANRFLDYKRLSAMAVGQPWRQFSPQQKQSFIAAFKEMVIGMYARSAMMGAEKADVRVLPKITANGNKVDVYSEILTPSGKKYEVAYQLYQTGSQYKLYNIRVDGVSIVTVYRNQFVELVNQQGIDGMIETVRNKKLKKAG